MTREEWIKQCAAQYMRVCPDLDPSNADDFGDACADHEATFHGDDPAGWDSPEDCADADMSEWTDDEGSIP